jgi:hypothetical protein
MKINKHKIIVVFSNIKKIMINTRSASHKSANCEHRLR